MSANPSFFKILHTKKNDMIMSPPVATKNREFYPGGLNTEYLANEYETDHYYWLKIIFKSLEVDNIAIQLEPGQLKLYYLTHYCSSDQSTLCDNKEGFSEITFKIPGGLDYKHYEKRIEMNSLILVFSKKPNISPTVLH